MIPRKGNTLRVSEKSALRRIYDTGKYKSVKFTL